MSESPSQRTISVVGLDNDALGREVLADHALQVGVVAGRKLLGVGALHHCGGVHVR